MELLLAYDGGTGSRHALRNLVRCALAPGTTVTVLTVADEECLADDDDLLDAGGAVMTQRTTIAQPRRSVDAAGLAMAAATQVRALLPDIYVRTANGSGPAGAAIIEYARARHTDLVVIGAGSTPGILGPTARHVLRSATQAVRIVRAAPDLPARAPAHIVVGIDGSGDSLRLIHAVASRAWPLGSRIWLVTARDARDAAIPYRHDRRIVAYHTLWADMLRSGYLEVDSVVEEGAPSRVVPAVARDVDAELILLAATDRRSVDTPSASGVVESIAAASECPVEIW